MREINNRFLSSETNRVFGNKKRVNLKERTMLACIVFLMIVGKILIASCSTIPKEAVELSYVVGQDLSSVQLSYNSLIDQFYENLINQRREYLDKIWYPEFLSIWRDDGELLAIAKKEKIFSVDEDQLIPTPNGTSEKEHLETLNDWVQFALYAYESKEQDLVEPLENEKKHLKENVNTAFLRLITANATITAHLNSIREVQEVQDEVLEALNIRDIRDEVNSVLSDASNKAQEELDKIKDRNIESEITDLVNQIGGVK